MTLTFLFSFDQLNLAFLNPDKRDKIVQRCELVSIKVVEIFEYKKNNDRYWDQAKIYHQVIKKALPIPKAFYPSYSLFFLFNNTTCHSIYIKNIL